MEHRRLNRALVLAAAWLLAATAASGQEMEPFSGKVVKVSDGDTLVVLRQEGEKRVPVKIRLHGVDCPERHQPFGKAAKDAALRLAGGKTVRVDPVDRDRYGRTVAEIVLPDGHRLHEELLRLGLAWWYRQYAPEAVRLRDLEERARQARIGLWSEPSPVAPWDYRRAQRGVRHGKHPGKGKHRR